MISRLLKLPLDENIFLFGPRGVGKTTYLKNLPLFSQAIYINLLRATEENKFSRQPDALIDVVNALAPDKSHHIIIDEIQKIPKLLDVVHDIIESTKHVKFILTGSSARKLKHGGANLLAGRAFVYDLYPFTCIEIPEPFHLDHALCWGMLPKIFDYAQEDKKQKYLETYTNTYLKEEVWVEQFVRELDPFRHFLEVAAQSNGKIINFSKIARDVGVSDATVNKYYSILEDTLLGFFLYPFQHSFRKRLSKTPKFYFFDPGVVRTLSGTISLPLTESTYEYGDLFEHFIILQCVELAKYYYSQYRFSFVRTKDDAEIDLVVERPGKKVLFIEIKSTTNVQEQHIRTLQLLASDFPSCEALCFSRDPYRKKLGDVLVLPWQEGIKSYFCTETSIE